jgi:hypothetical protein
MDRDIDMDTNNNMAIDMDTDIDKNIAINTDMDTGTDMDMNMDIVYETNWTDIIRKYLNSHNRTK